MVGEYLTKEDWNKEVKITPEELSRFQEVMKPLMDMSPKERAEFLKMQPQNADEKSGNRPLIEYPD